MSKYTTGEMARLCGVTVRTVQYYDTRGILIPAELSEGGRRLYSEEDLGRLKIICYLRDLGLSIDAIGRILHEERPAEVIALLLDERAQELTEEIGERRERLHLVESLQKELKTVQHFSIEAIGDIAHVMENKQKLRRTRAVLLTVGILMDVIEIGTAVLWAKTGIWWPFALGMGIVVALGIWVCTYYMDRTVYICPACHHVFRPTRWANLWARHTPRTRRLTCPACGHRGFCVETYGREPSGAS